MTTTAPETVTLRTALDTYGHTRLIKDGTLSAPHLRFDFVDIKPVHNAFGVMAERQAFDFSEMAIVTFLQAFALGKPILLFPAIMLNRFHHGSIICKTGGPIGGPGDLNGKRIGVRAYTQTTGVWVRGIYHAEYGLDLKSITTVTTEGGHLKEYVEPKNVVRAPAGKTLKEMLLAGEIDAWIAGRDAPKIPEFRPVLADAESAAIAWFKRVRVFPINHMVVLTKSIVDAYPWLPQELFDLLKAGKSRYLDRLAADGAEDDDEAFRLRLLERGIDPLPFGVEPLRRSLEVVIDYAYVQELIPRRYAVDDLFDPRLRGLT
jgi:4,5-dihydroxyphthalate decarboxylase